MFHSNLFAKAQMFLSNLFTTANASFQTPLLQQILLSNFFAKAQMLFSNLFATANVFSNLFAKAQMLFSLPRQPKYQT